MEAYRRNNIAKNILAVVFGIIAAILAFFAASLFLFIVGVLSWTDGGAGLPQSNLSLSALLVTVIGSFVGGFTTASHCKTNYFLYSSITGAILAIIWTGANTDFDLSYYGSFEIICVSSVLPLAMIGGWLAARNKKKRQGQ